MDKRKQPLVYMWTVCLCVCLYALAGCNMQTSPSPATPSSIALTQTSSAFAQVTPDVIFNLVGTYAGTYQWHGSSSPTQLRLEITKQDVFVLSGVCILSDQRLPLLNAYVETAFGGKEGGIIFMVNLPTGQRQQTTSLDFNGTVTKEGAMSGDVSASDDRTGTWSAQKT